MSVQRRLERPERALRSFTYLTAAVAMALSLTSGAHAMDLLQAWQAAEASDPTLAAARHTLEAAQEKGPQARAQLLPSLGVAAGKDRSWNTSSFDKLPPQPEHVNAWSWSLQLTQPLIRPTGVYGLQQAHHAVAAAQAQFDAARQDLMLRAAQAYFDVLTAQEAIVAADAQVGAMQQQLDQAKKGFEKGIAAVTDLHDATSRLAYAKSQAIASRGELHSKRLALQKIIGPTPGGEMVLAQLRAGVVLPTPDPADPQAWGLRATTENLLVQAARESLEAGEDDVRRSRAAHLPTLDMTASYGNSFSSGNPTLPTEYTTRMRATQIGLQLNIPLFAGGAVQSQVREAEANRERVRAQLEAAQRQAAADAQDAYTGEVDALAQIDALQASVDAAQSAVQGNQAGYRVGLRTNLDVLNAQTQRYVAQRDLVRARHDAIIQGLKLKAAAGVLQPQDLAALSALLDSQAVRSGGVNVGTVEQSDARTTR